MSHEETFDWIDSDDAKLNEFVQKEMSGTRGSGGPKLFWKPQEGDNRIRILPPWTSEGPCANLWLRKVGQHFNVGFDPEQTWPVICRDVTMSKEKKEPCLVDLAISVLKRSKDPADLEMAKEWRLQHNYHCLVIDLDDPVYTAKNLKEAREAQGDATWEPRFKVGDPKVQIWSFGRKMLDTLNKQSQNGKVKFTHPIKGHNILITRRGTKKENTTYTVAIEFDSTPLPLPPGKTAADVRIDLEELEPFSNDDEVMERFGPELGAEVKARRALLVGGKTGLLLEGDSSPKPAPEIQPSPPAVEVATPVAAEPVEQEDQPLCFGDAETHSDSDPECIGDPKVKLGRCPYFDACEKEITSRVKPRRRSAAVTTSAAPASGGKPSLTVDDIEAEIRAELARDLAGK